MGMELSNEPKINIVVADTRIRFGAEYPLPVIFWPKLITHATVARSLRQLSLLIEVADIWNFEDVRKLYRRFCHIFAMTCRQR